ncbi:MAG: aminotransferase class V-fold PLP-dependent enzyme, partial [Proteobacteria bacterium]|nr:aminotransferase class V-fold PLP-dependent enzyme [Pseudomonadota bacterium]
MFDPKNIKADFPILKIKVNGHPLVYLDNAATTQKPQAVLDAITDFYSRDYSNVHRGVHFLAMQATEEYESTRKRVAEFINARDESEIIFTRGTTESINLLAYAWGEENIQDGDEIVISILEHHSNLLPWQQLCIRKGATLKYIPIIDDGTLNLENLDQIITKKTKLVAITQMSNSLGTIIPLKEIFNAAKAVGAVTV